jgi:hypothetical protein
MYFQTWQQMEVSGHAQTTLTPGHRVPGPQTRLNVLSWLGIKTSETHNCINIADVWTEKYSPLTTMKLQNSNIYSRRIQKKKVNLFGSGIKFRKYKSFKARTFI